MKKLLLGTFLLTGGMMTTENLSAQTKTTFIGVRNPPVQVMAGFNEIAASHGILEYLDAPPTWMVGQGIFMANYTGWHPIMGPFWGVLQFRGNGTLIAGSDASLSLSKGNNN